MDIEHYKTLLRGLYIEENPYRYWAWILTVFAILILPRSTRRTGTIGFLVIAAMMGIFFGLKSAFKQFTPEPLPSIFLPYVPR